MAFTPQAGPHAQQSKPGLSLVLLASTLISCDFAFSHAAVHNSLLVGLFLTQLVQTS